MNSTLEFLAKEALPNHDYDRVGTYPFGNENWHIRDPDKSFVDNVKSSSTIVLDSVYFFANSAKHAVRGMLYGGIVGSLLSFSPDISLDNGYNYGVAIGGGIDVAQYVGIGFIYPLIKERVSGGYDNMMITLNLTINSTRELYHKIINFKNRTPGK